VRAARPAGPVAPAAPRPAAWTLPARIELGTFSRAGGEWNVEWERAHVDARALLDSIDFSRRDIVIWVPGTSGSGVHHDFGLAVRDLYGRGGDVSLVAMPYEASWELRRSLPTGLATFKLVLEGIRQRLAQLPAHLRPRILVSGESQGAWIIGESMADPRLGRVVDRAVLAGHPWLAKTQYLDGHDPRVRVINHLGDQITLPVAGDAGVGVDAMAAVRTGRLKTSIGTVAKAILANPLHGVLLLHTFARDVPWLRPYLRDPHYYVADMPRMVRYLRTGTLDPTDEDLSDARNGRPVLSGVQPRP
jgi:hypothetical protein